MSRARLWQRAREALDAPWLTRRLWIAALLLASPALFIGYVLDDLQQQSMVRGTYDAAQRSPAELYCFSPGPGQGIDPAILSWWDDPGSSLCFLRPISSWTLWVDHAFLWSWPALPHLHSILWFLGLWFAWRAILLRYLPTRVANLALLLTAASGAVAMTTAWVASRHALVGSCLGVAGLYHCLASRDSVEDMGAGVAAREVFGWLMIALGLLSSEMVLGVFGFLVAREWFTRNADGTLRRGSVVRIAGYAVCGVAYVGMHARLGYGAPKYPLYLNASGDPWTFLRTVPERLLALSGDLILGIPSDAWVYPSLMIILAGFAAFGAAMFGVALLRLHRLLNEAQLQLLRWLSAGALLSLAPCLSGMQGGRALTIAAFPAFALIGWCLILEPRGDAADIGAQSPMRRRFESLALTTLTAGALIGNPAAHFAWYGVLVGLDRVGEKSFDSSQASCLPDSDVYLIDASELGATAWYARYWLKDKLRAKNYRQLTMSPLGIEHIRIVRTGPSSMTMHSTGAPLVGEMAIPPGSEGLIQAGLQRTYPDYRVLVRKVSQRGPVEVDFEFSRPLSDPQLCLFIQDDSRLYQIEPPAIGADNLIQPSSPLQELSKQSAARRPDLRSAQLRALDRTLADGLSYAFAVSSFHGGHRR
jgi:hypothetical protein